VVLTDGYTPWPDAAPKGMRVVAGLLGDDAAGSAALGKSRPRTLSWVSKRDPAADDDRDRGVLLTFASGASDVTSFTRLGNVFTSVMTGNITVFGLSLARGSRRWPCTRAGIRRLRGGRRRRHADRQVPHGPRLGQVPRRAGRRALARAHDADASGGAHAAHWCPGRLGGDRLAAGRLAQYVILAVAACAMGIQSAAVVQLGLGNVSTTYLNRDADRTGQRGPPAGGKGSAGGARECWPACWRARR